MPKSAASRVLIRFLLGISIALFIQAALSEYAFGQRSFGIHYDPPQDAARFQNDLTYLKHTGINSLLIEDIITRDQMNAIEAAGFDVYVSMPVIFPTTWTLEQQSGELREAISRYIQFYRRYDNVKGLGLFGFGQTTNPVFRDFFRTLIRQISGISEIPLFYISSDPGDHGLSDVFDFHLYQAADTSDIAVLSSFDDIGGFIYAARERNFDIRMFQSLLARTSEAADIPVFLDWEWFVRNRSAGSLIEEVVQTYARTSDALFANPRVDERETSSNGLILLLMMIWGSFVLHYSVMPPYRKSLMRFFDNHRFFMKDIMNRHVRLGHSNTIILMQQAFIGGIFVLALSKYTLSPLGFEALMYHLAADYTYMPGFIIFLSGFLFFFVFNLLCTVWLFILNSDIHHIGQAAIFHIWPQHLNLLVITLLIVFIFSGSSMMLINVTIVMCLVVFFGSFIFAVFDAGHHTYTRFYYYPLTVLIYGAALIGLVIFIYTSTGFLEVWDLAASL